MRKIVLATVTSAGFLYVSDDLVARVRHMPGADVEIERYVAVPQKFNRIEYEPATTGTEHCIYTLLPHSGQNPCWYVMRHRVQFVDVG